MQLFYSTQLILLHIHQQYINITKKQKYDLNKIAKKPAEFADTDSNAWHMILQKGELLVKCMHWKLTNSSEFIILIRKQLASATLRTRNQSS